MRRDCRGWARRKTNSPARCARGPSSAQTSHCFDPCAPSRLLAIRYSSSNATLEAHAVQPIIIPSLVQLQQILPSKIPSVAQECRDAVVVHGDFKIDNLIYGSSGAHHARAPAVAPSLTRGRRGCDCRFRARDSRQPMGRRVLLPHVYSLQFQTRLD